MKKITTTSKDEVFKLLQKEIENETVYHELFDILTDMFSRKPFNISLFICGSSDIVKFNKNNEDLFDVMKKRMKKEDCSYTIKTTQKFKRSNYVYTIASSDSMDAKTPKFVLLNVWC